jgi:hypothetical protein
MDEIILVVIQEVATAFLGDPAALVIVESMSSKNGAFNG